MSVTKFLGKNVDGIRFGVLLWCISMAVVRLKRSSIPIQHKVTYSSSDCTCAFLLKIDEGIKFAKTVVAMGDEKELSSRGYLALGIGYSLLASEGNVLVILRTTKRQTWETRWPDG